MAGCEPILVEVQGNLAWPRLSRHYRWLRHAEPLWVVALTCSRHQADGLHGALQSRCRERSGPVAAGCEQIVDSVWVRRQRVIPLNSVVHT